MVQTHTPSDKAWQQGITGVESDRKCQEGEEYTEVCVYVYIFPT